MRKRRGPLQDRTFQIRLKASRLFRGPGFRPTGLGGGSHGGPPGGTDFPAPGRPRFDRQFGFDRLGRFGRPTALGLDRRFRFSRCRGGGGFAAVQNGVQLLLQRLNFLFELRRLT